MVRPASGKLLVLLLRISVRFQANFEPSSRAEKVGFLSGEYTKLYPTESGVPVWLVESTANRARSEGEADVDNPLCSSLRENDVLDAYASSHPFEHNSDPPDVQSKNPRSIAPPTSKDDFVKWMESMEVNHKRAQRLRENKIKL